MQGLPIPLPVDYNLLHTSQFRLSDNPQNFSLPLTTANVKDLFFAALIQAGSSSESIFLTGVTNKTSTHAKRERASRCQALEGSYRKRKAQDRRRRTKDKVERTEDIGWRAENRLPIRVSLREGCQFAVESILSEGQRCKIIRSAIIISILFKWRRLHSMS